MDERHYHLSKQNIAVLCQLDLRRLRVGLYRYKIVRHTAPAPSTSLKLSSATEALQHFPALTSSKSPKDPNSMPIPDARL